ncbi:MAG TPA: amino acid ABC transporter substrate-binding protein [Chitinophagaceae bacterium]|nr:amino acid ABC transporter substrate-binding protein [Chitinophagaceae bacterium]
MMFRKILGLVLLAVFHTAVFAQDSASKRYQVAVFTPLYLDSAFDAGMNYRYEKYFPKFFNPGLEFYEGVQLALDSLEKEGAQLDVFVYDLRSTTQPLQQVLESEQFKETDLILAHINNTELWPLAEAAARQKIPFINVNFPNDAGITNNPYFVILNSRLETHSQGIYRYLQRQHALSNIVVFRKKGAQEDRLQAAFENYGKTTASVPLKMKFVTLNDDFDSTQLMQHLNPDRMTACVIASFDLNFGLTISQQLASLINEYPVTVVGMPNWDMINEFSKPEYKNLEIVYGTPFYIANTNVVANNIQDHFKHRFYSRPSDMVYRGYETMLRFGKLLLLHGSNLSSSIGEKKFIVFNDFDIQPVFNNKDNPTLDFFENKKLYFIKKVNGAVTGIY